MTTWIAIGLQTAAFISLGIAGYTRFMNRLTVLETLNAERDKNAKQREELYKLRNQDAFEAWCKASCPRSTPRSNTAPGGVPIFPLAEEG